MNDDQVDEATEALWIAALGPTPEEAPLPPDGRMLHQGYDWSRPGSWPRESGGPPGTTFIYRWLERHLTRPGMTPSLAAVLYRTMMEGLRAGAVKAVAMHPEHGASFELRREIWWATGDSGPNLLWGGIYWADDADTPYDIYLTDPVVGWEQEARPSAVANRSNMDARIIYTLSLMMFGEIVDVHGGIEKVASELRARGIKVSNGTISDRLDRGRDQYDPATDTTRKHK